MNQANRHKVFISFYHDDQEYKDLFVRMMGGDIVDKSIEDGDIDDDNIKTETIRQKIRDDFIAGRNRDSRADRPSHLATEARGLGDRFQFEKD